MKLKKMLSVLLVSAVLVSMMACGGETESSSDGGEKASAGGSDTITIGASPVSYTHLTVAWKLPDYRTTYALDGGVYTAGTAISWLQDELRLFEQPEETEQMAKSVADTGGVFFVPAFSGLGAPHWDQYARGTLVGLTGGTQKEHIVRAALESIAYQVSENIQAVSYTHLDVYKRQVYSIGVVPENSEIRGCGLHGSKHGHYFVTIADTAGV